MKEYHAVTCHSRRGHQSAQGLPLAAHPVCSAVVFPADQGSSEECAVGNQLGCRMSERYYLMLQAMPETGATKGSPGCIKLALYVGQGRAGGSHLAFPA
jgi:hypothetical protein